MISAACELNSARARPHAQHRLQVGDTCKGSPVAPQRQLLLSAVLLLLPQAKADVGVAQLLASLALHGRALLAAGAPERQAFRLSCYAWPRERLHQQHQA